MLSFFDRIVSNTPFPETFDWLLNTNHHFFTPFKSFGELGNFILDSLRWALAYAYYILLSSILLCLCPIILVGGLIAMGITTLMGNGNISEYTFIAAKIAFDGIIIALTNLVTTSIFLVLTPPILVLKIISRSLGTAYDLLCNDLEENIKSEEINLVAP